MFFITLLRSGAGAIIFLTYETVLHHFQNKKKSIHLPESSIRHTYRLNYGDNDLEKEYEEEHHKVETGVTPERLINRSVPADETERRQ